MTCFICGHPVPSSPPYVELADGMGVAHFLCHQNALMPAIVGDLQQEIATLSEMLSKGQDK